MLSRVLVASVVGLAGVSMGGAVQECPKEHKRTTAPQVATACSSGQYLLNHSSGRVQLGVNQGGALNVPNPSASVGGTFLTGVSFISGGSRYEYTAPGCTCEGWGVYASSGGSTVGLAHHNTDDDGVFPVGLTDCDVEEPVPGVSLNITGRAGGIEIEHAFHPSASPDLYQVDVTITNIGSQSIDSLKYVRVMDWDMEPTAFSETVDINAGTSADLECAHNDGFDSADPTVPTGPISGPACVSGLEEYTTVRDQGAYFRFKFADINAGTPLEPGRSKQFRIFYGGSSTRAEAEAALGVVRAEVYSLGQPRTGRNGFQGIFAFAGVGGAPVVGNYALCDKVNPCAHASVSSPGKEVTLDWTEDPDADTVPCL